MKKVKREGFLVYNNHIVNILEETPDYYYIGYECGLVTSDICEDVRKDKCSPFITYTLSEDEILDFLLNKQDICKVFQNSAFSLDNEERYELDSKIITKSVNIYKNLSEEHKIRWIYLLCSAFEVGKPDIEDLESNILCKRLFNIDSSDKLNFDEYNNIIKEFNDNLSLPFKDRYKDEAEMFKILNVMYDNEYDDDEQMNEAFEYYLNMDCFKENMRIIEIKAYTYYEGFGLIPQDFNKSLHYLEILFKAGNNFAANSMGYIYYYGRVNGGVPQYELAYKYFTLAALAGIDEAIMKTSDMIKNGYYVEKNPGLAFTMISELAIKSEKTFEENRPNKYADLCLRLSSFFEFGLPDEEPIYHLAKIYALRAMGAIMVREEEYPMYGDYTVKKSIDKSLKRLNDRFLNISENVNLILLIRQFTQDNHFDIKIKSEDKDTNRYLISFYSKKPKLYVDTLHNAIYYSDQLHLNALVSNKLKEQKFKDVYYCDVCEEDDEIIIYKEEKKIFELDIINCEVESFDALVEPSQTWETPEDIEDEYTN